MTTTPPPQRSSRTRRRPGRLRTVRGRLVLVATVTVAALVVLMAVNAVQDWQQQRNLRNDSATGELGGEASLPLFVGAQAERKLTAVYLAAPSERNRAALEKQRTATDAGIDSFRHLSGTELETGQRHMWEYVERIYDELDRLDDVRGQADALAGRPEETTGYYTGLLTKLIEFYQALSAMDDPQLSLETRPLVGLFWASEGLAQQDMLIAQARAAGRMSAEQRAAFAEAYGAQRVMYQRWIAPYLPAQDRATYDRIVSGEAWQIKERVEHALISARTTRGDGALEELPRELGQWDAAYGQVAEEIAALNLSRTQGLLAHGYQRADEVRSQVLWQIAGSGAAIVVVAVLIIGIIRSITRRLKRLQAHVEHAAARLPRVVERLQAGEQVELGAEFPAPEERRDEFAGLEKALVATQRTAAGLAVRLAADRAGYGRFVAATALRLLSAAERALSLLADLQREHGKNAVLLEDLIRVDRLGVTLRRHLDNLLTLTGGHHGGPLYAEPKALFDAVNDARLETDARGRVVNQITEEVWVVPEAVNDLIHLLAALLDNALAYSQASVSVRSVRSVHGVAVEVEDKGTGMRPEAYTAVNAQFAAPPTFEAMAQDGDGRLGLFVVGHLARQHGLSVELRRSVYGGTTAVVMLPHQVLRDAPEPPPQPAVPPSRPSVAELPLQSPPAQRQNPAPDPAVGPAREPTRTDPQAPALPRRTPQAHLAPELARRTGRPRPARPQHTAAPEQVARHWAALQDGIRAADATHHGKDHHK